ncbi:hypothetical protein EDD85DRAFT_790985 [Armillaria nabsnona]|nr:hypothetical protein EDD85DRAFT_790985 [Armillaria nabsnona]
MPLSKEDFNTLTTLCPIPQTFSEIILPAGNSVNHVLQFTGLPPFTNKTIPLTFGNQASFLTEHNTQILQLNYLLEGGIDAFRKGSSTVQYPSPTPGSVPGAVGDISFPLWIILWWCEIQEISEAKSSWTDAFAFLNGLSQKYPLVQKLDTQIRTLPWNTKLPSALGGNTMTSAMTTTTLAYYCSQKWLKTLHLEQIIINKYRRADDNEYFTNSLRLADGSLSSLAFPVCVLSDCGKVFLPNEGSDGYSLPGNHWTSIVVDASEGRVYYADSFSSPLPAEAVDVLHWWLKRHGFDKFPVMQLPSTKQKDSYSCGILCIDAINHHFLPGLPLISSSECSLGQLEMLADILEYIKSIGSPGDQSDLLVTRQESPAVLQSVLASSQLSQTRTTISPTVPHPAPSHKLAYKPTSNTNAIDPDAPRNGLDRIMDTLVPVGLGPDQASMSKKILHTSKRKLYAVDIECSEAPDDAEFHFEDIKDPPRLKNRDGKDIGGCPKDDMMEKLTLKCWKVYTSGIVPKAKGYRCAAPGCREFHAT